MTEGRYETEAPVTVTIDMEQFVRHIKRTSGWDDESEHAIDPLMTEAISRLVEGLRKDMAAAVVSAAQAQVLAQVEQIVAETLNGEYEKFTAFGGSAGRTSLREQVGEAIKTWASGSANGYGRRPSNMEKFITAEVSRQMAEDLKAVRDENRLAIVQKMKDIAATLLAAEATRQGR